MRTMAFQCPAQCIPQVVPYILCHMTFKLKCLMRFMKRNNETQTSTSEIAACQLVSGWQGSLLAAILCDIRCSSYHYLIYKLGTRLRIETNHDNIVHIHGQLICEMMLWHKLRYLSGVLTSQLTTNSNLGTMWLQFWLVAILLKSELQICSPSY